MKDKKELIIELLVSDGDLVSTSRIANFIKSNQHDAEDFLNELLKEKKVEKLETPGATYWKYKYKKLPNNQNKEMTYSRIINDGVSKEEI